MNLRLRSLVTALLVASVMLAGCADKGDGAADADSLDPANDPTKGGFDGLLVDDNFRPIQLKETWDNQEPGDYQDAGFILIEETGGRLETTANGEFQAVGLNPGTYTLRLSAEAHEAIKTTVRVNAGEMTSLTYEARRKATDLNTIVTSEYAIFIPCNLYATVDCTADFSGDSFRSGIGDNFTEYNDTVTYGTWEMLLNNPYIFCLEVRERSGSTGASLDRHFGHWCEGQDSTYTKGILQNGERYNEDKSQDAWDPTAETDGILFTFGNNEATCWMYPGNPSLGLDPVEAGGQTVNDPTHNRDDRYRCAGLSMAVKAQLIFSMFMYEPEEGEVEDYCVICADE